MKQWELIKFIDSQKLIFVKTKMQSLIHFSVWTVYTIREIVRQEYVDSNKEK